jgi:general stress protein 26
MNDDLNARVKEALDRTIVMALSTLGPDGSWTCPVHYKYNEKLELFFQSLPDTKHVENIYADPRVSVAIFTAPGSDGVKLGLQIKGTATDLGPDDTYSDWHNFKITPEEVWCLDSRVSKQRQRVELSTFSTLHQE